MDDNAGKIDFSVIREAQLGSKEGMSSLVKLTEGMVFTFLYRATLDYHLSEDLCQDTMLDMIKSIKRLELSGGKSLVAWLFRTAMGKFQHHYRVQGSTRIDRRSLTSSEAISRVAASNAEPARALQSKEIIKTIVDAMATLSVEYRSALALRCFDHMSYAEIAVIMGGTQLRNKMLFYRARRALKRQLTRKGIGRSQLLGALGVFACVTSVPTKTVSAACAVGTGSLKVGLPTAIFATLATKTGIIVTSIVAALTLSTSVTLVLPKDGVAMPPIDDVRFAFPSTVIASEDHKGDGFQAINTDDCNSQPFVTTPEEILVGEPRDGNLGLMLPRGYSVELGFSGEISEGRGPDIFLAGCGCRRTFSIELTDGAGRRYRFKRLKCNNHCFDYHVIPFDIEKIPLSFEPRAIRISGTDDRGRHKGFELCSVRARISQQQPVVPE